MTGTVEHLPAVIAPRVPGRRGATEDHPMRLVTRSVAAGSWDATVAAQVQGLFDELAVEWHTRDTEGRLDPLVDAFERGALPRLGWWLEVGSGTGLVTAPLAERAQRMVAVDMSEEMLRRAPAVAAPRVRADQARLPFPDRSFVVVAHVNAFLFPVEVDRILAEGGAVVWVCTRGEDTPIFLPAEEVVAALPGRWTAVASRAGEGTWAVARRA